MLKEAGPCGVLVVYQLPRGKRGIRLVRSVQVWSTPNRLISPPDRLERRVGLGLSSFSLEFLEDLMALVVLVHSHVCNKIWITTRTAVVEEMITTRFTLSDLILLMDARRSGC